VLPTGLWPSVLVPAAISRCMCNGIATMP
jgi:hypothetical protein